MTPATRPGTRTAATARRQPRQPRPCGPARPPAAASGPCAPMRKDINPMRDAPPVTDLVTQATNGDKPAWDALVDR